MADGPVLAADVLARLAAEGERAVVAVQVAIVDTGMRMLAADLLAARCAGRELVSGVLAAHGAIAERARRHAFAAGGMVAFGARGLVRGAI